MKRKMGGAADRDEAYKMAVQLAGWHTPRWWWRALPAARFFKAATFVACMMAAASDNPVPARNLKRPPWFPKRYVYGDPKKPLVWTNV